YAFSLLGGVDIAIGDDRDGQLRFHFSNSVVFGLAGIQIGTSAAVQRQSRNADVLSSPGNPQRIAVVAVPAGAGLKRDRHAEGFAGLDDRFQNASDEVFVTQQGRTCCRVAYFFGGTPHVDVNDAGPFAYI